MTSTEKIVDSVEKKTIPMFDIPTDFVSYDKINSTLLKVYGNFPCKIEALIIALVMKGNVKASVNLWDYDIKENQIAVLIPGSFIQIREVSEDVQISVVGYSSEFIKKNNFWKSMSSMLMMIYKNPIIDITSENASIINSFIGLTTRAEEIEENNIFLTPESTKHILGIFISSIMEALKISSAIKNNNKTNRDSDIVAEFMRLAFENYREEHKISFYAREVNLTLSHFCNVISKSTGMTPQEVIMNLIIMDAKTQLKGTDNSVSKIASTLGFSTPTTFNRYFRTYTGVTPQAYRFG